MLESHCNIVLLIDICMIGWDQYCLWVIFEGITRMKYTCLWYLNWLQNLPAELKTCSESWHFRISVLPALLLPTLSMEDKGWGQHWECKVGGVGVNHSSTYSLFIFWWQKTDVIKMLSCGSNYPFERPNDADKLFPACKLNRSEE